MGAEGSGRAANDGFGLFLNQGSNQQIVDAVEQIATERNVPMAQVALAWVAGKPAVSAPIFGATKPPHIEDAVAALEFELTDNEATRLDAAYFPRQPLGF